LETTPTMAAATASVEVSPGRSSRPCSVRTAGSRNRLTSAVISVFDVATLSSKLSLSAVSSAWRAANSEILVRCSQTRLQVTAAKSITMMAANVVTRGGNRMILSPNQAQAPASTRLRLSPANA
jgi:hypothetical protein